MTIAFRCGHTTTKPDTIVAPPRCESCGETVVSRVTVRPPSFTGLCRGPFARFQALDAVPVDLRPPRENS